MRKEYVQPILEQSRLEASHLLSSSNPTVASVAVLNTAASFSGCAPQRVGRTYY